MHISVRALACYVIFSLPLFPSQFCELLKGKDLLFFTLVTVTAITYRLS